MPNNPEIRNSWRTIGDTLDRGEGGDYTSLRCRGVARRRGPRGRRRPPRSLSRSDSATLTATRGCGTILSYRGAAGNRRRPADRAETARRDVEPGRRKVLDNGDRACYHSGCRPRRIAARVSPPRGQIADKGGCRAGSSERMRSYATQANVRAARDERRLCPPGTLTRWRVVSAPPSVELGECTVS